MFGIKSSIFFTQYQIILSSIDPCVYFSHDNHMIITIVVDDGGVCNIGLKNIQDVLHYIIIPIPM